MYNKEIKPEFVPTITSELDVGNIDKMFTKEQPAETPEVSILL